MKAGPDRPVIVAFFLAISVVIVAGQQQPQQTVQVTTTKFGTNF
jgi:hypothetical protein